MASAPELVVEVRAIGHCSDCRWWTDYPNADPNQKFCALTETRDYEPLHPESRALPAGAGAHWKRLETRPDFGCVQWEAKDNG